MLKRIGTFIKQATFACLVIAQAIFVSQPTKVAFAESPTSIIISAVQITGGTGHTQEDFVEFYNPTDVPFDLNGLRLVKRTAAATTDTLLKSWSVSTIILPHHFYLWANSGFTSISFTADATTTGTLADNNGVALRQGANDTGLILDSVAWGSVANSFAVVTETNPVANESISRVDLFNSPSTYSIATSVPRNSSIEVLPPVIIGPPVTEPPTDQPPIIEEPPVVEPPPVAEPPAEDPPVVEPPVLEDPPVVIPPAPISLKITELLPNPEGNDAGYEQIEVYNAGTETVSLNGYKLDDIAPTDPLSSNALVISDLQIEPAGYLTIVIPEGKFALNNTEGDVVTLFNQNNDVMDTVSYLETAPEGKSWNYFSNGWAWSDPTFGQENILVVEEDDLTTEPPQKDYDNSGLEISEIYPQPNSGEKEFLEIHNSGEDTALLSEVDLFIGAHHSKLPKVELKSGEYYLLTEDDLSYQLRNSGQELRLVEGLEQIYKVIYSRSVKGSSYALFEDGYLWTTKLTKGKQNILQLPEEIVKPVKKEAEKTTLKATAKVASAKPAPKTATKKSTVAKTTGSKTVANKKPTITSQNTQKQSSQSGEDQKSSKSQTQNDPLSKIIAMGAAAVAAGVIAVYKFVFTAGIE